METKTQMASVDLSTSPWLIRIFDRVPLSLPAMGMLIALAYFLFLAMLALMLNPGLGEVLLYRGWQNLEVEHYRGTLGVYVGKALWVGYLAAAAYYGLREAVRDFQGLRPALSCDDIEFDDWLTRLRQVSRVPLYVVAAFAVVLSFFTVQQESNWTFMEQPPPLGSGLMSFSQIDAARFSRTSVGTALQIPFLLRTFFSVFSRDNVLCTIAKGSL